MEFRNRLALTISLLALIISACQPHPMDEALGSSTATTSATQTAQSLSTGEQAISDWLSANAIDLVTDDFTAQLEPLDGLAEIIGDSLILALGEQTHGTHEFFTVRQRLIRYAIEEMGYTILAVEAPWAPARTLNEYIHGADVDLRQALIEMEYWTFATEENLAFFEWLREYNQSVLEDEQVSFYGFDISDPSESADHVLADLESHSLELSETAQQAFHCLPDDYPSITDFYYLGLDEINSCLDGIKALNQEIDAHSETLIARMGLSAFEHLQQELHVIIQFVNSITGWLEQGNFLSREDSMVENILWILEHSPKDSRLILWAHNGHIAERYPEMLGGQLSGLQGEDYFSIGASFHTGSFLGRYSGQEFEPGEGLGPHTMVQSATPYTFSFEHYFSLAPMDFFVLPLQNIEENEAGWLLDARPFRQIGAAVGEADTPDRNFYTHNLVNEFDAIYFSRHSTPSQPLILYE